MNSSSIGLYIFGLPSPLTHIEIFFRYLRFISNILMQMLQVLLSVSAVSQLESNVILTSKSLWQMALKYFFVLLWLACDKFPSFCPWKLFLFTENSIKYAQASRWYFPIFNWILEHKIKFYILLTIKEIITQKRKFEM